MVPIAPLQPVYDNVTEPGAAPVTEAPPANPTELIVALLLLVFQVPPVVVAVYNRVAPTSSVLAPDIVSVPEVGFTETTLFVEHPLGKIYDIRAVPEATPVPIPVLATVALATLLLLHVPPVLVVESVVLPGAGMQKDK